MSTTETTKPAGEHAAVIAAAKAGDEPAFSQLVERYRPELRVHCYRMLGSFEDSEDLMQETFLRAWRRRASFEGRSSFRAFALDVLRVEDGRIAEITSFINPGVDTGDFEVASGWDLFAAFGLPRTL
jgi:Sigma-70 region 2